MREQRKNSFETPIGPDAFIWALALKFTNSREEAAAAVEVMNQDIGKCAAEDTETISHESRLRAGIAWRRLIKFLS